MALTSSILFKRDINSIKCPSCKKYHSLRRSHSRDTKEKIFNYLTFRKLYRCKSCGWRGYKFKVVITKKSLKNILLYIILILLSLEITRMVLSKVIN